MGIFNSIFNRDQAKELGFQSVDTFSTNDNSQGLNSHLELQTNRYVSFGDMNLYPNYLNDLYNSSGLHSAIIDFKKNLTIGEGFTVKGESELSAMQKVEVRQFLDFFDGNQRFDDVIKEITMDYMVHGTIYFKVHWNSDKTRALKLERLEPSKVRVGVFKSDPSKVETYFVNFNWKQAGQYPTKEYPPFNPMEKDGNRIEVFRYQVPNSAMNFYTLPSYASGTNWINLDGEVSTYHKSNIENAINPSMTVKFYKKPANNEEKRKIVNGIKKQFQGASNTGKAMIFFSDDKDTAPDVEPIKVSNIDKQFNVTADAIQRNICYAHKVNPLILGLKTPGSLGNSTEMETAFEIFQQGVIQPAQRDIEGVINRFLRMNGLPISIKFNDVELFSTEYSEATRVSVMTENELREDIGLKTQTVEETGEDSKTKDAQASLKGSVGGVSGIITLLQGVTTGEIASESAISVLIELYGFTEEVAQATVFGKVEQNINQ